MGEDNSAKKQKKADAAIAKENDLLDKICFTFDIMLKHFNKGHMMSACTHNHAYAVDNLYTENGTNYVMVFEPNNARRGSYRVGDQLLHKGGIWKGRGRFAYK